MSICLPKKSILARRQLFPPIPLNGFLYKNPFSGIRLKRLEVAFLTPRNASTFNQRRWHTHRPRGRRRLCRSSRGHVFAHVRVPTTAATRWTANAVSSSFCQDVGRYPVVAVRDLCRPLFLWRRVLSCRVYLWFAGVSTSRLRREAVPERPRDSGTCVRRCLMPQSHPHSSSARSHL